MNINISDPFFLHRQIVLHDSHLAIDSVTLSKILGIPYPKMVIKIRVILRSKSKADLILTAKNYRYHRRNYARYLITPDGVRQFFRPNRNQQRLIEQHLETSSRIKRSN